MLLTVKLSIVRERDFRTRLSLVRTPLMRRSGHKQLLDKIRVHVGVQTKRWGQRKA